MHPLLEIALRAAMAGGEAVMRVYADPFEVIQKDDSTPVTEADLASERAIVEILSEAFPDIPIVSEETVPAAGFSSPASRFWCVDPLDGTKEFVARNGEFAVLIGLIEHGVPVLGVVHGPAAGVTYVAHGPGTAMRRRGRRFRADPGARPVAGRDRRRAQPQPRKQPPPRRVFPGPACHRAQAMRQRAQIRRAGGGRGRFLPALRHDDGVGHRRRAGGA